MQPNKSFQTKVFISLSYILLLAASACSSSSINEPAATLAPPTPIPSPTTDPSIYPFAMDEPDPNAELEYGPWVFYQVDPQHQGGNIAFQNLRGSVISLLDDPSWMGEFELYLGAEFSRILLPSPEGDRVAFYVIKENKAQVWVLHIPSQKIQAKIDLFLVETEEDPTQILDRYLWRQKMIQWSPDGNYLAVVAGLQGAEHSLLLYDFNAHERSVIAKHVQHLGIVDWSPDSHSVVYVSLPTIGPNVAYASVWAATVEGQYLPIGDMSPSYMSYSLGWLDFGKIVIGDRSWEGPPSNFRTYDVNSGKKTNVLDDFTATAFLLPDWVFLFDNIYEGSIYYPEAPTEMEQGIYKKQLGDGQLDLLLASKTAHLIDWYPEIEKFLVFDQDKAYLYTLDGEIAWEVPVTQDIFPSPDGRFILVGKDPLVEMYDPLGYLLWSTPASSSDRIVWMPDSSGFLHFGDSDLGVFVSLYKESSNWQAEILDNVIWTGYDYKYFILE